VEMFLRGFGRLIGRGGKGSIAWGRGKGIMEGFWRIREMGLGI
jgi:hypothetical protein